MDVSICYIGRIAGLTIWPIPPTTLGQNAWMPVIYEQPQASHEPTRAFFFRDASREHERAFGRCDDVV